MRRCLGRWAAGLAAAAIGLAAFSWWGLFTVAGNRRFDEMDGLYPAGAGLLAAALLFASAVLVLLAWRRRRP
ncbi:MAG: hypothetical protein JNK67_09090 [Alphaproteobacteria bacterium]|nr:hypothetical protein [Alphaproteobacteria bacterium]